MSPNTKKHNKSSASRFARLLTLGNETTGNIIDARGNGYTVAIDGSMRGEKTRPKRGRGKSARRLRLKAKRAEEFA